MKTILNALLLVAIFGSACLGQSRLQSELLVKGKTIEKNLDGSDSHSYQLSLRSGEFAYVEVLQKGIDVVVQVFDPAGKKIDEVDSPNGTQGIEPVIIVTGKTGSYRFRTRVEYPY